MAIFPAPSAGPGPGGGARRGGTRCPRSSGSSSASASCKPTLKKIDVLISLDVFQKGSNVFVQKLNTILNIVIYSQDSRNSMPTRVFRIAIKLHLK